MAEHDHDASTTQRRTWRPDDASTRSDAEPAACLVVLQGQRLGHRIDLGIQPVVVGRGPDCDVQIGERSVSRQRCRIWREPVGYRIRDLDSTNRTFLNDRPVAEAALTDGDRIAIGSCVLKFMDRTSVEVRYHEEIYRLATVDPLTELYNRRQLLDLLEKELARAANHDRPLALMIIDIDHFKSINDRFGHPTGDAVLKRIARLVESKARDEFILARLGGEEFCAVLPEFALPEAVEFAEVVRAAVATCDFGEDGVAGSVTVSIGVATAADDRPGNSGLLRAADVRLYRAKQGGRNQVCPSLGEAAAMGGSPP